MMEKKTVSRRDFVKATALGGGAIVLAACAAPAAPAVPEAAAPVAADPLMGTQGDEMKGKKISMSFAVIAGWPPSQAPIELFPDFAKFAKEKYGYDVEAKKTEAGFDALFQKIAPTLASKSQEYNIMVSDSQWLGALSEPGWIVKADDVFAKVPELDIEPYSSLVRNTYQIYPDGSNTRWGFPQMPDTQGLFVRKDMLDDAKNKEEYKAKTGKDFPAADYDSLAKLTIQDWEPIWDFFAAKMSGGGTAIMQSKTYDFFSCAFHTYIYATGGDIWDPKTGSAAGVQPAQQKDPQRGHAGTLRTGRFLRQQMPGAASRRCCKQQQLQPVQRRAPRQVEHPVVIAAPQQAAEHARKTCGH